MGSSVQERTISQQHTVNEQPHAALQTRIVIEQAKGILAARHDITLNQAFDSLRHQARSHRILLSRVAQGVIDTECAPDRRDAAARTEMP